VGPLAKTVIVYFTDCCGFFFALLATYWQQIMYFPSKNKC
jgi:hypothetical protein